MGRKLNSEFLFSSSSHLLLFSSNWAELPVFRQAIGRHDLLLKYFLLNLYPSDSLSFTKLLLLAFV